jgi:hypothetical protein
MGEGAIAAVVEAQLQAIAGELRGARSAARLHGALDELMRVQAVAAGDAAAAVACLDRLDAAADDVAPLRAAALDLFAAHRQRIAAILAGESMRAGFVASRARASGLRLAAASPRQDQDGR